MVGSKRPRTWLKRCSHQNFSQLALLNRVIFLYKLFCTIS